MKEIDVNRRHFLTQTASLAGVTALATPLFARAEGMNHAGMNHSGMNHSMNAMPKSTPKSTPKPEIANPAFIAANKADQRVRTLNGWSLPYVMKDGVKEFHLVAEEIQHEFAPGSVATCWGYNGSTPGPTIEAIEGDHIRIFVTNLLKEPTSVHWHGLLLPSGMDGVSGLNQPSIQPNETYCYEFQLKQHGTQMYHPHADEMTQMALGMMGLFIIHPKQEPNKIDRDYAFLIHNYALHPGTSRPDPNVMQDFDLWTFNSKTYPAIEPLIAQTGERVRIRIGNLSMWNHPIHLHGVQFWVTGGDGGRLSPSQWRTEVTEIVGVGQMRDIEFIAVAGDWAFHCHMSHHTMGPMGHDIPNTLGVNQRGLPNLKRHLPGFMPMGEHGMSEHSGHMAMGMMRGPKNTLPMMTGQGAFGAIEMGGMFTVLKVRDKLPLEVNPFTLPWYDHPPNTLAYKVSKDPMFGEPIRRK